jgi:predicted transcriptional regulator of viral defense system
MKYNEFKNSVQASPLIFSRDLLLKQSNKQIIRNQLQRWQKKKLIIQLKRGVFLLNANDRKVDPSRHYIANQLYSHSYISLESALSIYGLIPERVCDITSVTSKKTMRIKNELGVFIYQHIKVQAFRGFTAQKERNGLTVFIAEPEKALVDFCYLNSGRFKGDIERIFEDSYRLQNTEALSTKKLTTFAECFNSPKLLGIIKVLCMLIRKERQL